LAKKLTDIAIRNMKPSSVRQEIPDGNGLYLIVQTSGAKSFALRFRRDGKQTKLTLGTYFAGDLKEAPEPTIGGVLTLKGARKLAADAMLEIGRGGDPGAAKRQAREKWQQAAADTLEAIATQYMKRECGMKIDAEGNVTFDDNSEVRTAPDRWRILRRQVFPALGSTPVTKIRKSDIVQMLDDLADGKLKDDEGELIEGGRVSADRCLALIRRILNWHASRSDDYRPPLLKGLSRVKTLSNARARVLKDDELRVIWKVSGEAQPFPALVRFLLLTGARRSEASEMRWEEVKDGDWLLPASRNKTKRDLLRPLSRTAQALLEQQPKVCHFVFTPDGRSHISAYGPHKAKFDAAVLRELKKEDPKAKPLENWTLHDLRRTARSLMSRAGVPERHAEQCLGHVIGGVQGIYDRHRYLDEMRRAYEALARQIETIVNPPTGNVVAFQKAGE
jgi:integrase